MRESPRGLQERIGVAVSSGSLASDAFDLEAERGRERIGALGAATLIPAKEPTSEPIAPKWDDHRRIAELLWRLKYGDDRYVGHQAAVLFAWWLRRQPMFERFYSTPQSKTLFNFAARVIVEWCYDRCQYCGGTSLAGVDPKAAARNVLRHKRCPKCLGHPGKARVEHAARALAIDLPLKLYHRHFEQRFTWAHEALARIVRTMKRPIAAQLNRRGLANLVEED